MKKPITIKHIEDLYLYDSKIRLTENEIAVIRAYKVDCFVSDRGWECSESSAWTQGFHNDCGLDGRAFSGTMSSLSKKGLITCYGGDGDPNDAFFSLTDLGREAARVIV